MLHICNNDANVSKFLLNATMLQQYFYGKFIKKQKNK